MSMGILSRLALKPNTLTSSEPIRYPTVYSSTTSIKYVESLRCMSVDAILRSTRNSYLKAPFYLYQRIQLLNFYLTASIYQRRRLTTVYVRHWRTWPPEITKKDIVQDWDGLSTRISTKSDFKFLPYCLELPATSTDHGVCPSWRTWPPGITKNEIVQDWDGLSTRISMKSDFRFLPYSLELPTTSTDHGVCPRWRAWPLNSPRWKWNRIGMMV